jgi:hypothetical protein
VTRRKSFSTTHKKCAASGTFKGPWIQNRCRSQSCQQIVRRRGGYNEEVFLVRQFDLSRVDYFRLAATRFEVGANLQPSSFPRMSGRKVASKLFPSLVIVTAYVVFGRSSVTSSSIHARSGNAQRLCRFRGVLPGANGTFPESDSISARPRRQ